MNSVITQGNVGLKKARLMSPLSNQAFLDRFGSTARQERSWRLLRGEPEDGWKVFSAQICSGQASVYERGRDGPPCR